MTDLSPEAQALLRQARAAFSPSETRLQAVRAALKVDTGASLDAPHLPASSAGGLGVGALGAAGWSAGHALLAAVAIGAMGAGALAVWPSSSHPATSAPTELLAPPKPATALTGTQPEDNGGPSTDSVPKPWPAPQEPLGFAQPSHELPAPLLPPRDRTIERGAPLSGRGAARSRKPEAMRETPASPPAAPAKADEVIDSLAEEVHMLREARSALDRGDAAQALKLLDAHETRFQRGTLHEERLATRVQALCALGFVDRARAAAQELERTAPRSPHLMRVRASCVAGPPSR